MKTEILIKFKCKFNECPEILANYILEKEIWENMKVRLLRGFEIKVNDFDNFPETVFVTDENLHFQETENPEIIEAFKKIFGQQMFNYDIWNLIKTNLRQKIMNRDSSCLDEYCEYYIAQKKHTPEFSSIEDTKIMSFVTQTKKAINDFK